MYLLDQASTDIYTLSLHDALPILCMSHNRRASRGEYGKSANVRGSGTRRISPIAPRREPPARRSVKVNADRKSTRLNSSHANISYAVFCLKKKNIKQRIT